MNSKNTNSKNTNHKIRSTNKRITFEALTEKLRKPPLYEEGDLEIWRDDHISKGMLEAHLSEQTEAASRNRTFIDQSVDWISSIAPADEYPKLLDLGCGPGLYTERFLERGYEVTGVDYSSRSIQYARDRANLMGNDIRYIKADYLDLVLEETYDVITLIYCDFGALKLPQQIKLLENIDKWLKPGGKLIFDVLTNHYYEDTALKSDWYLQEASGYWKPYPYVCFERQWDYEPNIKLNQYVLLDSENNLTTARVWTHYFTKKSIVERLSTMNHQKVEFYSDVKGEPFDELAKILCVVVQK